MRSQWKKMLAVMSALTLAACGTVTPPAGQESKKTFTQDSSVEYVAAYRLIAKQMRACYRNIGLFGNGYDVQADLDSGSKEGRVELYHVGLSGAGKPDDSIQGRTITIKPNGTGSIVTITGTVPERVYGTYLVIGKWLAGYEGCSA